MKNLTDEKFFFSLASLSVVYNFVSTGLIETVSGSVLLLLTVRSIVSTLIIQLFVLYAVKRVNIIRENNNMRFVFILISIIVVFNAELVISSLENHFQNLFK